MSIQLLDWIENIYFVFIKNEFLETNWDHVYNDSQRLFKQPLSVILIKTSAIIHLCHHSQNELSWNSKDFACFNKILEIGLSIKNGIDDMKGSLPWRLHQLSQTQSQSCLDVEGDLFSFVIFVNFILTLCQIRFQVHVLANDISHFYMNAIIVVWWPPLTTGYLTWMLAFPRLQKVLLLGCWIFQDDEMHGHKL